MIFTKPPYKKSNTNKKPYQKSDASDTQKVKYKKPYKDDTSRRDEKDTNPHQPKFKQSFVDFIVEEKLPFILAKEGPRCYIQIEKRNLNTMDLVKQIMQMTKLPRKKIGIA